MVQIKKTYTEVALTSDGKALKKGDLIVLTVGGQDIVTRFDGIDHGYFKTVNDRKHTQKYRMGSIDLCYKVDMFVVDNEIKEEEV